MSAASYLLRRGGFFWASSLAAVGAGGGGFGGGAGAAAFGAEVAGHPGFRAEDALQQRGHVEVGVQAGPVQAEAGGGDFDVGEVFVGGAGQAFGEAGGEGELDAGVEGDDDARAATVVACG